MPTNWTPGEWRVSPVKNGPIVVCGQRIECIEIDSKGGDSCWLAQVQVHHCIQTTDGGKDNANLFAASKNLYRELAHLVSLLEPLEQSGSLNVPGLATLNGARAALAKARGESA